MWVVVRCLEAFKESLLSKWRWRFLNDKKALWRPFLEYRYEALEHIVMGVWELSSTKKASLRWRNFKNSGSSEIDSRDWFLKGISCRLGNDNNIMFWSCNWFGGILLRLLFTFMFQRSYFPHATIKEMRVFIENN